MVAVGCARGLLAARREDGLGCEDGEWKMENSAKGLEIVILDYP